MTQPSKNGENAVDMLAVARIAQGVDIAGFAGPDAVKLVAPAKVNLFLDIGAKRADGYHEAVSIMHALMLHDVLRMKLAPGRGEGLSVDLSCVAREGLAMLDVPVESNIVAKAVRLLAEKLERTADETVVACLEKHIPAEAAPPTPPRRCWALRTCGACLPTIRVSRKQHEAWVPTWRFSCMAAALASRAWAMRSTMPLRP